MNGKGSSVIPRERRQPSENDSQSVHAQYLAEGTGALELIRRLKNMLYLTPARLRSRHTVEVLSLFKAPNAIHIIYSLKLEYLS
jgi:hypothetical protein